MKQILVRNISLLLIVMTILLGAIATPATAVQHVTSYWGYATFDGGLVPNAAITVFDSSGNQVASATSTQNATYAVDVYWDRLPTQVGQSLTFQVNGKTATTRPIIDSEKGLSIRLDLSASSSGGTYPLVTMTPIIYVTAVATPKVTVSGKQLSVRLETNRGFTPQTVTIKTGDEIIWTNDGTYAVTLVSSESLFEDKFLSIAKRTSYTFMKTGTFSFYLKDDKSLSGSIIVEPTGGTVTPAPIIYVTPIATPLVTTTAIQVVTQIATPGVTPIMTTTPTETENGKVAILQVIYNIGRKDNGAEVTVSLKNVGSSTARFVDLSMNIPAGLGAILESGAEMDGNTMVWKGDIEPGKEHVIKYQVGAPKTDIEIPVKVTYINSEKTFNKVMAKASAQGMSVSAMAIETQDLQTILLIIQIAKSLTPGFEIVFAITGIGAIYIIRKVKIRP